MTTEELKIFEDGYRAGEKKGAARAVEIIRHARTLERQKASPNYLEASETAVRQIANEFEIGEKV